MHTMPNLAGGRNVIVVTNPATRIDGRLYAVGRLCYLCCGRILGKEARA
jgi:hypothetical protein